MIFVDPECKRVLKVINREVSMVAPAALTKYFDWAEMPIIFDQSDHPAYILTPGQQALVVDPLVCGV